MANRSDTGLEVSPLPPALSVPWTLTDLPETDQTGVKAWNWNDENLEGWSKSNSINALGSAENRLNIFQINSSNPFILSPDNFEPV
jgi:hypothetical protein